MHHPTEAPLDFLRSVEDPTRVLRDRLAAFVRCLPAIPSVLSAGPAGRVSLAVEAQLMAGCYEGAAIAAQRACYARPEDPDPQIALAKAYIFMSLPMGALKALRRAHRLGARGAEFTYLRALLAETPREQMDLCLTACEQAGGSYPDALFLAARVARLLGWKQVGRTLLRRLRPHLADSAQRPVYEAVARELGLTQPVSSVGGGDGPN